MTVCGDLCTKSPNYIIVLLHSLQSAFTVVYRWFLALQGEGGMLHGRGLSESMWPSFFKLPPNSNRKSIARSSVVGLGVQTVVAESSVRRERAGTVRNAFLGAQVHKMGAGMSARSGERPAAVTSASGDTSQQTDFKSVSDGEWKKRLSQQQFNVTRKKGTERAFTGEYWSTKTAGTYLCVCCKTPLFSSSTKFDSGTGWPSYYEYIGDNVKSHMDWTIPFMPRTEVLCAVCDAHLGHVFSDGPRPSGKRYCINSAALDLKSEKQ